VSGAVGKMGLKIAAGLLLLLLLGAKFRTLPSRSLLKVQELPLLLLRCALTLSFHSCLRLLVSSSLLSTCNSNASLCVLC
jgi:hypothetical protein